MCLVTILFVLQSCGRTAPDIKQGIDTAEKLMIDRPDSALVILGNIDIEQISSRSDRARYAVLYTQAKDKNYIDETDITLIGEAKAYYENSDDVRYRFLSLYYYGRILYNAKDYTHAMIAYTQAESLLDKMNDCYMAGLLYSQIGDIFFNDYDYEKGLEAYRSAYEYYTQAGLELHSAYALLDIGTAYWNMLETAIAVEYINKALKMNENIGNSELEETCYRNLIMMYDKTGDVVRYGEIVEMYNREYDRSALSSMCLASLARYYTDVNEHKQAEYCLERAWKKAADVNDSINVLFKSANIMKTMRRYDDAWQYLSKGIDIQNNRLRHILQQPVITTQKEHFENQAKYNSYRLKKNTEIYMALFVIVLLITIIIVIYMRHRILTKDMEIGRYMDLAAEMQASIRDKDMRLSEISVRAEADSSRLNEMSGQIAELFHRQYELLDKLSNTYYETHGCSKDKECIYEQVKKEINKFANDKKSIAQLETIVNTYKHNVINLVRNEISGISERDIKLLCFVYAGFSAKSISTFIGETTGNIQTRKYRLRAKINKSDAANKSIMLQEMP